MECWILFDREDVQSADDPGCYEIRRLIEAGIRMGVVIRVFRPERFHLVTSHQNKVSLLLDGDEIRNMPDVVLPRLGVLSNYFALSVIRQFERMGAIVLNKAGTISTVMDKMRTQQALAHAGIPVPKTMLARFPIDITLIEKTFTFPLVIKTLAGTQGQGVVLAETPAQLRDIMHLVEDTNPASQIIFQEFIRETDGRDLRVFIVDGRVAGCMMRKAPRGDFKANISNGGTGEPYKLDAAGREVALRTARTLRLDVAGIDLLFSDNGYKVCEANSAPDFSGMEKYCDVRIAEDVIAAMKRRVLRKHFPARTLRDGTRRFIGSILQQEKNRKMLKRA